MPVVLSDHIWNTLLQQPQQENTGLGTRKSGTAITILKNVEVSLELHHV